MKGVKMTITHLLLGAIVLFTFLTLISTNSINRNGIKANKQRAELIKLKKYELKKKLEKK